ncbi:MAG: YegS/Rv2252/BmrU family lipid kinase [Chthoniobacterales bacterium]
MKKRYKILLNPTAGASNSKKVTEDDIRNAFRKYDDEADIHLLAESDDIADLITKAESEGFFAIVSAGGDGTLKSIAIEQIGRSLPLGILPLGTYNNTSLNLKIPFDFEKAVEKICHGNVVEIDVGKVSGGDYFLEAAGAGIDAALFPFGEQIKSGRFHRFAEVLHIALTYRPRKMTLRLVDRTGTEFVIRTKAILVLVANGVHYGSNIEIAPEASLFDGLLTVKVMSRFGVRDVARQFLTTFLPLKPSSPKIATYDVRSVQIESRSNVPFHVDGKEAGDLPASCEIVPSALKVIV